MGTSGDDLAPTPFIKRPTASPRGVGSTSYLPTLDGWRAIAILWVMLHHDGDQLFGTTGVFPSATLLNLAHRGPVGVDVFFAISGFLICSRLIEERRKHGRIDLRGFYIRRSFRILPPYLLYLLVVGLLAVFGLIAVGRWEYESCFLFVRNYLPTSQDGLFTRHFWSLAVEEHFYLIWPGLFVLAATSGRARWASFGLGLLVTAWRGIDARSQVLNHIFTGPIAGSDIRTDTRIDGLFFGCWAALLLDEPTWKRRLTRYLGLGPWLILLGVFTFVVFVPGRVPVYRLWIALLAPMLLVGTVVRPETPVARFLEIAPLKWIGRVSYSLYLWQQLFLVPRTEPVVLGVFQALPIDWLMVVVCALSSYFLLERPMIAVGHRLSRRSDPHKEAN